MTILRGITPTPVQLNNAYREVFGPAINEAAGKDGRLTPSTAERLAARSDAGQLVADNLKNFFDATGQKSVGAGKFIGLVGAYAEREASRQAGSNQRLSLVELRNLPADLVGDVEHLRGTRALGPVTSPTPRVAFTESEMHDFLYPETGTGWQPSRTVDQGTISHDGTRAVVSGLSNVGEWQGIAEDVLKELWPTLFVHRAESSVARIGDNDNGTLLLGPVVHKGTGEAGVLAYWNDIDDNRHAFFYAKDNAGAWKLKDDVYLN